MARRQEENDEAAVAQAATAASPYNTRAKACPMRPDRPAIAGLPNMAPEVEPGNSAVRDLGKYRYAPIRRKANTCGPALTQR
jgi:hypothetical protein